MNNINRKIQLYKDNKPFEETEEFSELLKTQYNRLTNKDLERFIKDLNYIKGIDELK